MILEIANKGEVASFMADHIAKGNSLVAVKGPAPVGATFSDGDPIECQINVAWRCQETGEEVKIKYKES